MGGSDPSARRGEEEKRPSHTPGAWRQIGTEIWIRKNPPPRGLQRLTVFFKRIGSLLIEPIAMPFLALSGVFGFVASFALAYDIGGVRFFGLILLLIWGGTALLGILVLEKSGYARNFEGWDFPMRRILYGIPGLFLGLGFIYFILIVLGHHF